MTDAEQAAADAAAADDATSTDDSKAPDAADAATPEPEPTAIELAAENAKLKKAIDARERDNFKLRERERQRVEQAAKSSDSKSAKDDAGDNGAGDTLRRALIRQAFRAEALTQGMDPDFVDVVQLEPTDVVVMDDGTVSGMAEAVTALLAEQPKLKATSAAPGTSTAAPGSTTRTRGPQEVRPGEVSAMGEAEFTAWADSVGIIETQDNPSAPVLRWNVSPTPNAAHGRVRSAAASKLVDRVTGAFEK